MKYTLLVISIPVLIWMSSCHRGNNEEALSDESGIETSQSGELVLTRDQFSASGMIVGDPFPKWFSNEVSANGMIVASLSGRAKINTLIPGRVKQISHAVGDVVRKGEALFSLESHEIILLQQEYAGVIYQLDLLKAEYERYKSLSDEKIIAQKDFQKTESEYRIMLSRAEGLRARLEMIHIDPSRVENGTIIPFLTVHSPIKGIVTRQELVLGQYIETQVTVMEVVDTEKLQILLRVFEQDLAELAPGQKVEFYTPDQKDRIFEAAISHIGKSIDPDTKTVQCIAELQPGDRGTFVNNLYVESRIVTCQREAFAIPEQALIREHERDYVWILVDEKEDQMTFRKIPVHTGITLRGYTEVLDEGLSAVLLEGAYNLWIED